MFLFGNRGSDKAGKKIKAGVFVRKGLMLGI